MVNSQPSIPWIASTCAAVLLAAQVGTAGPVPRPPEPPARGGKHHFQVKVEHKGGDNWALTLAGFLALAGTVAGADAAVRWWSPVPSSWRVVIAATAAGAAFGAGVGAAFHRLFGVEAPFLWTALGFALFGAVAGGRAAWPSVPCIESAVPLTETPLGDH